MLVWREHSLPADRNPALSEAYGRTWRGGGCVRRRGLTGRGTKGYNTAVEELGAKSARTHGDGRADTAAHIRYAHSRRHRPGWDGRGGVPRRRRHRWRAH